MEELLRTFLQETHLSRSDRGFLTELVFGAIRMRGTLRVLSEHFLTRPMMETHRSLRAALAIGLYQRVYLQTPPHAVVDATIEAWRSLGAIPGRIDQVDGAAGLLNAVLRRACEVIQHVPSETEPTAKEQTQVIRANRAWVRIEGLQLPSEPHWELLGAQYSHPPEMVRLWLERFEEATIREILDRNNQTPSLFLAVRSDQELESFLRVMGAGGLEAEVVGDSSLPSICVKTPTPIEQIPGYANGEFWVQDRTARRLAAMLPQREGDSLLDLCAAPGGKLATLLDRGGISEAIACDVSESKLRRIAENLVRLRFDPSGRTPRPVGTRTNEPPLAKVGLTCVPRESERLRFDRKFDQIIVDAPCSNTGVLNRRHEARWRFLPEEVRALTRIQHGLLEAAVRHLAAGGDLLYTTCSLEPSENAAIVFEVLSRHTDLRLVEEMEILPGDEGGDGGYGALLKRDHGGW